MFKFIAFALLSVSFAQAAEINVLEVSSRKAGFGNKIASFVIGENGEASVRLTVVDHNPIRAGRYSTGTTYRSFEEVVPALSMSGEKLLLNNSTECGTMGVTRILKNPTLNLSGNCELEVRSVRKADGKKVVRVVLITE